jgi:hypothetical protein
LAISLSSTFVNSYSKQLSIQICAEDDELGDGETVTDGVIDTDGVGVDVTLVLGVGVGVSEVVIDGVGVTDEEGDTVIEGVGVTVGVGVGELEGQGSIAIQASQSPPEFVKLTPSEE